MFEVGGIGDVRATAKVDEVTLFVHGDLAFQIGDMFDLIMVVFENLTGFLRGNLFPFEGNGFFGKLLHFCFDGWEILLGNDPISEVDVIVETFIDSRAESE